MAADLAFLKSLLTFTRDPESSIEEKFINVIGVLYNHMGPKMYHHERAKEIALSVNPMLVANIASSVIQCEEDRGEAYAIGVLEHKLIDVVTDITGQSIEELDKELKEARLISKLMTEGIHINIDNTNDNT